MDHAEKTGGGADGVRFDWERLHAVDIFAVKLACNLANATELH